MMKDAFWELFRDTGEPMCWLMHRARDAGDSGEKDADAAPKLPEKNTAGR